MTAQTPAQRQAKRRAALKAQGELLPSGVHPSRFKQAYFIGIDGEGWNDPTQSEASKIFSVGQAGKKQEYIAPDHHYTLLAESGGTELYDYGRRLKMTDCFDFLLDVQRFNLKGILVAYGAAYDMQHMIFFDLNLEQLKALHAGHVVGHKSVNHYYEIELRPRKSLRVRRYIGDRPTWIQNAKGKWSKAAECKFILWDVIGFFQSSFLDTVSKWLSPDHPDLIMLKSMKDTRGSFGIEQIKAIREYNQCEVRLLAEIMSKLRDSLEACNLTVKRWDGAGAVAAAMYQVNNVKSHKRRTHELDPLVFAAARCAYAGGHIENMKIGCYFGEVFHADLNSAYPNSMLDLPSLANGRWVSGTMPLAPRPGFTMVKLKYRFTEEQPFYPLFYRRPHDNSICFPREGSGWYWWPEYEAALQYSLDFGFECFEVLEWIHWQGADDIKPFAFVSQYYETRQSYIENSRLTGIADGREMILKLGLNSLYGKMAQQVGSKIDPETGAVNPPPFFQLEWAGYVTSKARASMMFAAMQKPRSIVAIATDGIYATEPLDLPHTPGKKILGEWDIEIHKSMMIVAPGVYYTDLDTPKKKTFGRGFGKAELSDHQRIIDGWKRGWDIVQIGQQRLIGLGSACVSKDFYKMRGRFAKSFRALSIDGDNTKRHSFRRGAKPHLNFVDVPPKEANPGEYLAPPLSGPYPIAWLGDEIGRGELSLDLLEQSEEMDCVDII